LHSVNEAKGFGIVYADALLRPPFAHIFVSVVFALVSDENIDGEAEGPERYA